MNGFILGGSI